MDPNSPKELNVDALMDTIRALSVKIGPRRPASPAERDAARYVHTTIRALDPHWEVINQPVRSMRGFRYRILPLALGNGFSLIWGLSKRRRNQVLGGLASVGISVLSRDAFLLRPAPWQELLARGESQNVIVRIPPRGSVRRRVVFVAHLDSSHHRVTTEPRLVRYLPRTLGSVTLAALVGGVLTALSGRKQRWRTLRTLLAALSFGEAALAVADELGPTVAGANGNASGVAALLSLAGALHAHPTASTEVVLAFTSSATAVGTGADLLATAYGEEWADALWVEVSNVGAGELCWVTQHGVSPYAHYYPAPEAIAVMERAADARPDLGLMGKPMITLDEVAILRDRNLRAVALSGYDRVTGFVPQWGQASDTIHEIDPATLERAAHTVWTVTQVVDQAENWPLIS
ncbi:M28 family peptidase [Aggregatilinea lenta]|uniref:M28 family peptidase n=1 Tax=Aggregatilinea lenta TaxID=913108 RepID=UPI000E5A947A|nr:M28 family peptidase [Aggregatilinea lenta]